MSAARPILVAATRQHVGKTTVSLALLNGLTKRFAGRVGFIKPVGQQHVTVTDTDGNPVRVDKDVELVREYFDLQHLNYGDISPVIIPKDYTKQYIDGKITSQQQVDAIRASYARVSASSDFTLLEGTGHVGVGAIVEMSNAAVAATLDADVVLVANGGLGSAFDELELNRALCERHGVRVRGVILNKVRPEKLDMISDYARRLIEGRWNTPLLAVVPDLPFLAKPSLADIESVIDGELLAGERFRRLHYGTESTELVTTGLRRYLRKAASAAERGVNRPLYVTHCTRDDIVLGFLAHFQKLVHADPDSFLHRDDSHYGDEDAQWGGAMILCTGRAGEEHHEDDQQPFEYLLDMIRACNIPVLLTKYGTKDAMDRLTHFTAKLNITDRARVAAAIAHYEPHIDFDRLLQE